VPIEQFADGCFICQPTVFFKRSMWVLQGKLDLALKTAFDFDYWLRAFKAFPGRIGFVDDVQACSRLHDDCITLRMRRTVAIEGIKVLAKYLGYAPPHWLLTYRDELLALPPESRGIEDLRSHLEEAIVEVGECLAPEDLLALRALIGDDSRLA
jgi:hypothetical protein